MGASLPKGERQSEGYLVDFKRDWDKSDKALRVVAGFANTFGGIIVIGVSEHAGRADEIVGVPSAKELRTQIAGSIAANIAPTPDYDIAECALPSDASRRLAVIRVRPSRRIHYLLKKGSEPVYIRNEDQAIPAPAAELRALVERERSRDGSTAIARPREGLPGGFYVSGDRKAGCICVEIRPRRALEFDLDYSYEESFKQRIAAHFPSFMLSVVNDMAAESDLRTSYSYIYKINRRNPEIESLWSVMDSGAIGFTATAGVELHSLSWSVPDVAANIASTISFANDALTAAGYYGEVAIAVDLAPEGGIILAEGSTFVPLMRKDYYNPWPNVVPQYEEKPMTGKARATGIIDFNARSSDLDGVVSVILNQLLRDLGFAADLATIRSAVRNCKR